MRRLAKDAQKWVKLHNILKGHVVEARRFVTVYCQHYNANQTPQALNVSIGDFEANISNRIS
jgi:hypothetical protein